MLFFFCMNFPQRTAFVVSCKFWLLSFHFHLYQDFFLLVSYLISSLTHWFFRSLLFNLTFFLIFKFYSCNWFLVLYSSGWKDSWYDLRSLIELTFHLMPHLFLIPDNFRKLFFLHCEFFLSYFLKELLDLIIKVTVMEFRIIPMKFILSFLLILL